MGSPARGDGRGAHGQGAGASAALGRRAASPPLLPPRPSTLQRTPSVTPRPASVSMRTVRTRPSPWLAWLQVEDLSRQVATSRQQPVTVVHTGGSGTGTGTYVLYGAAGAVLGVVVYYRVFRGWTLGDMLYATRRGLKEGLAQVSTGGAALG